MDVIMAMPLMEFFNYAAMLNTMEKEQMDRLNKASKLGFHNYITALAAEML